jgi:hypothetical protein
MRLERVPDGDRGPLLYRRRRGVEQLAHEGNGADERKGVVDIGADAHGDGDILDGEMGESHALQDLARPVGVGQSHRSGLPGRDILWWARIGAAAAPAAMIHSLRSSPCGAVNPGGRLGEGSDEG